MQARGFSRLLSAGHATWPGLASPQAAGLTKSIHSIADGKDWGDRNVANADFLAAKVAGQQIIQYSGQDQDSLRFDHLAVMAVISTISPQHCLGSVGFLKRQAVSEADEKKADGNWVRYSM